MNYYELIKTIRNGNKLTHIKSNAEHDTIYVSTLKFSNVRFGDTKTLIVEIIIHPKVCAYAFKTHAKSVPNASIVIQNVL